MAEMAAKAHEISLEAGSRMAGTMREVIGAAAGLTAFAIESARDLVQYMVRRGQMSQDEADKLMREVEAAHATSPRPLLKVEPRSEVPKKATATAASAVTPPPQIAINVEPPVVPRPLRSIATEALDEEDEDSIGDPDADTADFDDEDPAAPVSKSAAAAAKAPTPLEAAPAKAPHPPAQKSAKPPVLKPAAKPAARPAPKVAAKAAPKKAVKVATKPPARKSAPPRKK
jgi:hypothetical protein